MKIDRDEARRIANLAHLSFDEAGLDRMAGEMTKILEYIEMLREADVPSEGEAGSLAAAGREDARATLRDDVVTPSIERAAVEKNAPEWSDGFFVVPPVIEGE